MGTSNGVHTHGNGGAGGNHGSGGSSSVIISAPAALTPREWALEHTQSLIAGHRDKDYGPPIDNFSRAAGTLSALGYRAPDGGPIRAHDIAIIMLAIKLARLAFDWKNDDTWIDILGYGGCGYEVALHDKEGT